MAASPTRPGKLDRRGVGLNAAPSFDPGTNRYGHSAHLNTVLCSKPFPSQTSTSRGSCCYWARQRAKYLFCVVSSALTPGYAAGHDPGILRCRRRAPAGDELARSPPSSPA